MTAQNNIIKGKKMQQQRTKTTINRKKDLKGFKENTTIQPNPQQPTKKHQRKYKHNSKIRKHSNKPRKHDNKGK